MAVSARELVDKWLSYARTNGISIRGGSGRPPEDTDVINFLTSQGFDGRKVQQLIKTLPDATSSSSANNPAEPNMDNKDNDGSDSNNSDPIPSNTNDTRSNRNTQTTPTQDQQQVGVKQAPSNSGTLSDEQITSLNKVKRTVKSLDKKLVLQLLRDLRG